VGELEALLDWADVVVLMVSSVYEQVEGLAAARFTGQSWVVERATLPEQVIYSDLSPQFVSPTLTLSKRGTRYVHSSLPPAPAPPSTPPPLLPIVRCLKLY